MTDYIKKSLFVTFGLVVMGFGLFFGNLRQVDAAVKEGQKFSDWTVQCITDANNKQVCLLSQAINVTKDGKLQTLAFYQIGYLDNGSGKKTLKMVQMFPTQDLPGILITPGTSIIASKKLIAPGKYITCNKDSCSASADISDADLKDILSNNNNPEVGIVYSTGQQVNYPFSTKGLEEGLKAIK